MIDPFGLDPVDEVDVQLVVQDEAVIDGTVARHARGLGKPNVS